MAHEANGSSKNNNKSKFYPSHLIKATPQTLLFAEIGDPATGNVNAQMFGVLNLTESTLTYDFYTVQGDTVLLFDTLNVYKD